MAFINLSRDLFENVTISLTPTVAYSSGSTAGITGSAYLMPIKSKRLKEIRVLESIDMNTEMVDVSNTNPAYDKSDYHFIDSIRGYAKDVNQGFITNIDFFLNRYLQSVNDSQLDIRYDKNLPITRIDQPTTFSTGSAMKRHIKNVLMPYYRHQYDDCGFYYRNHHTLNFFTGSNFNTGSVLIYPNKSNAYWVTPQHPSDSKFTLQFWINPRYQNDINSSFRAGTIFHMSGSIAVSLISGSNKDQNGLASTFKVLTQFKHTSETSPHDINLNSKNYPNDLWATSSFSLNHNSWHHVSIRWSPEDNNKTGSILIDGNETQFSIPSSSLYKNVIDTEMGGVCVGNHFKGHPHRLRELNNSLSATEEGTIKFFGSNDPSESTYSFNNPLNAEIHEVKFYNSYLNDNYIINSGSGVTQADIDDHNLKFYLPPYFYPESHGTRKQLFSPEFQVTTSSYTPANNLFAFAADGKEINLENFTREMIKKYPARLLHLTTSTATSFESVDQFMFDGNNAKRNLTILPNDNGLFKPSYHIIESHVTGAVLSEHYTGKSYNNTINNYDLIKLENTLGAIAKNAIDDLNLHSSQITNDIFGLSGGEISSYSDEAHILIKNAVSDDDRNDIFLAVANELKEDSSNHIGIFNISNLYYGNRIKPGSFQITDSSLTGSQGKFGITLKDNGRGGIYRADCLTAQADWNCVGNLFYDEGLLIIKSPHLMLYGKDYFETSFKGENNIHSLIINVPAPKGFFDKSVNDSFISLPKSSNKNDENTESICISGINIHDKNFNIIMRANLAQPIIKDSSDEFVIRLKMDF
jgi:hypothetical protein